MNSMFINDLFLDCKRPCFIFLLSVQEDIAHTTSPAIKIIFIPSMCILWASRYPLKGFRHFYFSDRLYEKIIHFDFSEFFFTLLLLLLWISLSDLSFFLVSFFILFFFFFFTNHFLFLWLIFFFLFILWRLEHVVLTERQIPILITTTTIKLSILC